MDPHDVHDWWHWLNAALLRYEEAKRRVGETAIERLELPSSDGTSAHLLALREETEALREYRNMLTAFAKLVLNR
jgi:hypothetical protein